MATKVYVGSARSDENGKAYNGKASTNGASVTVKSVSESTADGSHEFQTEYQNSEGYVVDVYTDGIHLRGRDFVKGKFLPIASYWLDTTLQTVEPGTYIDSTGTIVV